MLLIKARKSNTKGSLSAQTWHRFKRNPVAMTGLFWIFISVLVSAAGYLITPDSSPFANQQNLEIATRKPGFAVNMLLIRINSEKPKHSFPGKLLHGKQPVYDQIPIQSWWLNNDSLYYEVFSGQEGYPGLESWIPVWDVIYAIPHGHIPELHYSISMPTLSGDDALSEFQNNQKKPKTPINRFQDSNHYRPFVDTDSLLIKDIEGNIHIRTVGDMIEEIQQHNIIRQKFLLGTDRFGRDMFSQLIIGMRVSLSVGFIAVFISLAIGIALGSIAGYYRGKADNIIVWLINVVWSIPTLLLVIAITFAIGKGFWQVFLAVGLTMWVEVARVVRGQIISIREKEFVEAARALGFSDMRIIGRHILPNIIGPVIVISAANFASAILIEAGLSFLGIGVQPPMPSWGTMIRDHYGFIILDKGFLAILPGAMIMMMVLAFMLVGNGLREALDRTSV
jgi:peptide/nickel transport system permease protein